MSKSSNVNIMALFTAINCRLCSVQIHTFIYRLLAGHQICFVSYIFIQRLILIKSNFKVHLYQIILKNFWNPSFTTIILVEFLWGFKTFLLFDSSGFEETFCAMNRTKLQMFVKGWDCSKFFKTKKIYNNAISFLRRSLWKLWSRHSVESSLQVLETSVFAQSRPSDSHNIRKIANIGHKTTYI